MMHVLEMPFQIIFYAQEPKPVASIAVSAMTLPRPQHSQEQIKALSASKCLSTTPTCLGARALASYRAARPHGTGTGKGEPCSPSVRRRPLPLAGRRARAHVLEVSAAWLAELPRRRARGRSRKGKQVSHQRAPRNTEAEHWRGCLPLGPRGRRLARSHALAAPTGTAAGATSSW